MTNMIDARGLSCPQPVILLRSRIKETDNKGRTSIIRATVPLKELQSYSADLNSMTGGRGTFEIEFSHYEEVPSDLSRRIIDSRKAALAGEEEEE